jgi:hypothetical protein
MTPLGELPSFVKDVRAAGSPFPAVHYWVPERTGDAATDYERGRLHFGDAVAFSLRPNAPLFLAYVVVAMFANIGPMERGFLEAMIQAAQVGRAAPRLTDEEVAVIEVEPSDQARLREIEAEMAEALAARCWLPDLLFFTVFNHLGGAEGEFVGGSMTMFARTALNGKRN